MFYRNVYAAVLGPAVGVLCLFAASLPAAAQEFFAAGREFVIDKACDATTSIKTSANPTTLEQGKAYTGRGVNRRQDPTHAFIRVGPDSKWVELGCGHFADGAPVTAKEVASAAPAAGAAGSAAVAAGAPGSPQCLPFFDAVDNPVKVKVGGTVDITPKPPTVNAFDDAITKACGTPGKVVSRDEFKALMRANPAVLDRVKSFTSGKVFADRPAKTGAEAYLSDLTEAWFAIAAFDHIFCGEPGAVGKPIGGMHFAARYLQLQKSGDACRMNNFGQNEVVPGVIYTMGVIMKNASGQIVRDARKGYGLTLNGEDILKAATLAFSQNPIASVESKACIAQLSDDGQKFSTVFVRRAAGIRTLYPDATPNGSGAPDPACASAISLQ